MRSTIHAPTDRGAGSPRWARVARASLWPILGLGLLVALVGPRSLSAQPQGGPPDRLFDEGRALMQKGAYAEACAKFGESFAKAHSPGRALNLSACEEKQTHLVKAIAWLDEALSELAPADERVPGATAKRDELEARLPKLTVTLRKGSPDDATLTIDGVLVKSGARTPVDPGTHQIIARASGHRDETQTVSISEKDTRSIEATIGPPGEGTPPPTVAPPVSVSTTSPAPTSSTPSEPPAPPLRPVAASDPHRGDAQRTAGWVVGGVGATSLIGAIVTGSIMLAKNGAYHACGKDGDQPCSREENPDAHDARNLGSALRIPNAVLFGVGLAGVGLCPILVLTAPKATTSASASPVIGPGMAGMILRGSF